MPEEEEHYLNTRDEILDQITVLLAGRAAEELVFSIQTTGASNDIERATDMARKMITMFGMSERFGLASLESIQNRYLDGRAVSNCSEETKTEIDREVIRTLKAVSYTHLVEDYSVGKTESVPASVYFAHPEILVHFLSLCFQLSAS